MIYIIDFVDTTSNSTIQQYFSNNNITLIKEFNSLGRVYQVESAGLPPNDSTITSIIEDNSVSITPQAIEYRTFPISEDDQHWWKLATVNIKDFSVEEIQHPLNFSNVDVYILDGGIKADHVEFTGVNIENVYSYTGSYNDESGHGTAIASIISGNTCALSTANLKIVKLFGAETSYLSHLLTALDTIIVKNNASPNVSIVNMSWHITKNAYVESKLQKLVDNNVLIVCAAGNNGQPIENVTPASMADAITVGAYNKDFSPCDFSNYTGAISNTQNIVNYGSLDVWAPGEQIYVATIDGGYGYVGGTSIAAAIETAALAYQIGDRYTIDVPEELLLYNSLRLNMELEESSRSGILVLENQYSNSVNRVASMYSNYTDARSYQTRFLSNIAVYLTAGEHSKRWLYYPRYSETINIVTPLPAGLSINNGWIVGTAELSGDDLYSVQECIINHTSADGEYIAEQKFRIVVTKPNLTIEDFPEDTDDEIMMYVKSAFEGNFCRGSPSYGWGYCGTQCQGGFYCIDVWFYCGEGKSFSCSCRFVCP
jgi:hypothetical protein